MEDFRELRKTLETMNMFSANLGFFFLHLAQILVLEVLAWLILHHFGSGWTVTILISFLLTVSQVSRCPKLGQQPQTDTWGFFILLFFIWKHHICTQHILIIFSAHHPLIAHSGHYSLYLPANIMSTFLNDIFIPLSTVSTAHMHKGLFKFTNFLLSHRLKVHFYNMT